VGIDGLRALRAAVHAACLLCFGLCKFFAMDLRAKAVGWE
jgi:hypothetical protein